MDLQTLEYVRANHERNFNTYSVETMQPVLETVAKDVETVETVKEESIICICFFSF